MAPAGIDPVLFDAVRNPQDRLPADLTRRLDYAGLNSYQRLIAHRIGSHFGLGRMSDAPRRAVIMFRIQESRIPDLCSETFPTSRLSRSKRPGSAEPVTYTPPQPNFGPAGPQLLARPPALASRDPKSSGLAPSASSSTENDTQSQPRSATETLTMEEREARYQEARARIFDGEHDDDADDTTAKAKGSSPTGDSASNSAASAGVQKSDAAVAGNAVASTENASATAAPANAVQTTAAPGGSGRDVYDGSAKTGSDGNYHARSTGSKFQERQFNPRPPRSNNYHGYNRNNGSYGGYNQPPASNAMYYGNPGAYPTPHAPHHVASHMAAGPVSGPSGATSNAPPVPHYPGVNHRPDAQFNSAATANSNSTEPDASQHHPQPNETGRTTPPFFVPYSAHVPNAQPYSGSASLQQTTPSNNAQQQQQRRASPQPSSDTTAPPATDTPELAESLDRIKL
ncbi:hypothetical protein BC831DRAFT_514345 [Entophlyctis helioformis]|nr:hypothetical protein BC831DRAFT_514345 [Entophlyctis helioformis]